MYRDDGCVFYDFAIVAYHHFTRGSIIDMVIGYYPPFVIQHHAAALREDFLVAVVGIDRYHGICYFFVNLFGIQGLGYTIIYSTTEKEEKESGFHILVFY